MGRFKLCHEPHYPELQRLFYSTSVMIPVLTTHSYVLGKNIVLSIPNLFLISFQFLMKILLLIFKPIDKRVNFRIKSIIYRSIYGLKATTVVKATESSLISSDLILVHLVVGHIFFQNRGPKMSWKGSYA